TLRADAPARRRLGLVSGGGEVWAGERRVARVLLSFRVRVTAPVVHATRELPEGAVIGADDVAVEPRDLAGLPEDAVSDPAAAVGLKVTRTLAEGTVLRRS
ncbi:MAG: SAF domain-containing protein, partial [bacterium]